MAERPVTDLDELADRISSVLNELRPKLPLRSCDVDLRIVAELCWAIGVSPSIAIEQRAALTEGEDE